MNPDSHSGAALQILRTSGGIRSYLFIVFLCVWSLLSPACRPGLNRRAEAGRAVPVIYSTDLFHPHDDPDDHFDLAALYALSELDILGIVLDQGQRQAHSPGRIPVEQMNAFTRRKVPIATGLARPLQSPDDTCLDQEREFQAGVELILDALEVSEVPVTLITVGSLRDTAAAFNRRPDLFRRKARRLLIFIGEASAGTREWNVGLDPEAFVRIMNSGLPIWWVPCFDGGNFKNRGHASYWSADQADLLREVENGLLNYFIYALLKKSDPDHLAFLTRAVDREDRLRILSGRRNLWCAAVFTFAAGRAIVQRGKEFIAVGEKEIRPGDRRIEPFRFLRVSVSVDEGASVLYEETTGAHRMRRYEIADPKRYDRIMTSVTRHLLGRLSDRTGRPGLE